MQLNRQTGDNYGTIKVAYFGLAKDFDALIAANSGSMTGFSQSTIDTYLFKPEFEFEKGAWAETSNSSQNGDSLLYELYFKFRQMNPAVRAWRKFWLFKEMICLVYDFQGNEILFGSKDEPLTFSGKKPNEQRATDGSFYDVVLSTQMRNAL